MKTVWMMGESPVEMKVVGETTNLIDLNPMDGSCDGNAVAHSRLGKSDVYASREDALAAWQAKQGRKSPPLTQAQLDRLRWAVGSPGNQGEYPGFLTGERDRK